MAAVPRRVIWVVDDSPLDAERVRRVLEGQHEVVVFHDGAAALERLSHGDEPAPDVLVLDWVMPGLSGPDVCRFVRSSEAHRELGVLLLTMHRETRQIVEGLEAGANDFVSKPFEDEELRARVAALVRARELRERVAVAEADSARLLELARDPFIVIDAQGVITFGNDALCAALGLSPCSLSGKHVSDVLPGLPLRSVDLGAGRSLFPLPDLVIRDRVFEPIIRALPGDSAARTTMTLRDVTHERVTQARRFDFYSVIAHDLKTPLSASLLRTDVILRGKFGVVPPKVIAEVRRIDATLRGLISLINDFLEVARLQGGGYKIELGDVDLTAVFDDVADELGPLVELRRQRLTRVRPGGPALVRGDRRRLVQVVSNLLSNAIKFTPTEGAITTRVTLGPDFVEGAVQDTGPGIPREELPTVFDRFARTSTAERGEVPGSGLGLTIARELVHAHRGSIGVDSRPGEGSTFWFRLPRGGA